MPNATTIKELRVHKTKAYPAKFATLDEKEGRVEALVSIFGR
jgi:hypothetical protein